MSRTWSVAVVVVAGAAMWLVVGWPDANKRPTEDSEPEIQVSAPGRATTPVAQTEAARRDAAVAEPEAEPAPDEEVPAPAAPPPVATGPVGDMLQGDRGPVEEYRALYHKQARDSEATAIESAIRQAFGRSKTPDLLQSVSCHESVCKVLMRWAPERTRDYILAARWLAPGTAWPPGQPGFESSLAITTVSETDRDGTRLVELYLKRRSRAAGPTPSHPH